MNDVVLMNINVKRYPGITQREITSLNSNQ